jgi:anthranilate phosphoribosyltransferase
VNGAELNPQAMLGRLMRGESLERAEAEDLIGQLMDGTVSDTLKAALLVALAMKGESEDEILGAATAMRARALHVPCARTGVVDTCGTGGDGKGGFNISTAAAFVAAAAGAAVAKHGNRSVSSRSGSSDVLAALGLSLEIPPEQAGHALEQVGIAFLFAPRHHPAVARVMPVRRELAVRTLFNVLGPLTNPAGARRQLMGVYAPRLVPLLAGVLARLGCDHGWVVHGSDGFDEITTTGPTRVAEVRGAFVRTFELDPLELGVPRARPEDLLGGGAEDNARVLRRILGGEPGPLADMVAVNAGAALHVADLAPDLADGLARARAVLRSGAALAKLEQLRTFHG